MASKIRAMPATIRIMAEKDTHPDGFTGTYLALSVIQLCSSGEGTGYHPDAGG
jgi:hypothetical protein